MKKFGALLVSLIVFLCLFSSASAADNCQNYKSGSKVWWDGIELKPGQIGRLTIKKDTPLFKLNGEKRTLSRTLKAGEFYRIYAFKPGLLSVGGGYFVERDSRVTYQTPSKTKLEQVKQIQVCTIANKSRATFTLKDSKGISYKVYAVGSNEQKAYGSFSSSATWNSVWAGISEGDVLYKGNYKLYLQKQNSPVIADTGIQIKDYVYNASRKMMYQVPTYYIGQPDLLAIANTESSNFESADLYYVHNGQLFRVMRSGWAAIGYTTRPSTVDKLTYQTKDYNNADGVWTLNTWTLNPDNAEITLIDSQDY
ncbi:hypothetical protein [Cytobacillus firmus]|uniref:Uncharacterized protein n=1 Tax=Cytobacillus firmus DS1 TaxID=1307436 RepID=W7LDD9_CYTFI|nr:hypothetical protein [Cytobacillus firmus]EWG10034.1 hypothetical protein PBF_16684 [Cytobacillus firmus DS1]